MPWVRLPASSSGGIGTLVALCCHFYDYQRELT